MPGKFISIPDHRHASKPNSDFFPGCRHCRRAVQNASNGPKRVALVVGNDGYKQVSTLMNAKADATAIARSLEKAGFKVTLKTDVNLDSFKVALRSFKATVSPGDEAVFFFSGHGVEMGGANYLLPIDIKGDAEDQVRDDAVPLQRVLEDLQERKARFSLAIIDACRNNPFRDSGRAIGGRGLAPTTAATGQMVLYSAGSGQQALDRLSDRDPVRNGVFTRVLLKEMETPGLPVGDVLRNVREQVASLAKSVGKDQVPAIYDQSLGRFYFTQPRAGAVLAQAQGGQTEGALPAALNKVDPAALDLAFWDSIKSSQDRSDFEEYLRQFPEGRFSGLARNRMRQLSAAASSAPASVPASVPAAAPAEAPAAAPAAAASGESIYQQGNKYWNGTGVAKNEVEAVRLYRQAADLGHAASQSMVGFAYDLGRGGIAKNDAEALRWYRLSANQGYAHGQYLLGTMYQNGQAVAKDLAEARRWFQLSANQGNENGKKALERLETASAAPAPAAPSVESLFKQANDLWNGNGVAKNETEAGRLYRQAADQGHSPSQASLGYALLCCPSPAVAASLRHQRRCPRRAADVVRPAEKRLYGGHHSAHGGAWAVGHVSGALLLPHAKLLTRAAADTRCALPCSATSPTRWRLCSACSTPAKTPPAPDSSAAFAT